MNVRVQELQQSRHDLLNRREEPGANVKTIDMQLHVVRAELQALYASTRENKDYLKRMIKCTKLGSG